MFWFAFVYVLVILSGSEAALMVPMSGGSLLALLPFWLFVVPALFSGVDLWHLISARLPARKNERSEFVDLARFVACWLITSVPPTLALVLLVWLSPQMFTKIHSVFDCWRMAMSICIWHGFLSLHLLTSGRGAVCVGYFVNWARSCSPREAPR